MPIPSIKGLVGRSKHSEKTTYPEGPAIKDRVDESDDVEKPGSSNEKVRLFRGYTFAVVMIVSIGGLIFGYGRSQIPGLA